MKKQNSSYNIENNIQCLTMEHEVLTDSGWKYFQDIDITKDKIYTMEFKKIKEYGFEKHKFKETFKNPLQSHYYPDIEQQLYHIKNEYIDTIITANHRLPCMHGEYNVNYGRTSFILYTIDEIYEILNKEFIAFIDENVIELFINEQKEIQIKLEDITKLEPRIVSTFCFIMPDETFYVRRNGKEYWTGTSSISNTDSKIDEIKKDVYNVNQKL